MTQVPDRSDRRKKPRYAVTEIIEVYVAGAAGRFIGCGVLRDVSETGAGLHMEVPVAPETIVELTNSKGSMRAVCRHTDPAWSGYIVGFEFLDSSDLHNAWTWSPLPATW
jgi:hypothetical protein